MGSTRGLPNGKWAGRFAAVHFLGIEIGESATRVVALDLESAALVAEAKAAHEWIDGLPDGFREQDPVGWIGALNHAMKEVLEALGERRKSVAAIGITAAAGGMVALDEKDRVVRPAKLGTDTSALRQVEEIARKFGGSPGLIELTGNSLNAGSLAAQALWLKQHEPAHFARTAKLLTAQDFIGYWLTGVMGTSPSTATTTGLFSLPRRGWCQELVEFVDPRLGKMLAPGIASEKGRGRLRMGLARNWGLPETVLVAAGTSEVAAGIFAAGAALPGDAVAELSANGALAALAAEVAVDFRGEGSTGCDLAGNVFTRMAMDNVVAASELVQRHYGWSQAEGEEMLKQAQPGAGGLLLLPYFMGEAVPRLPEGSGVLHGVTLDNFTPGNLARAAGEGVALGFGYAMSRLRELGMEPEMVRLTRDMGPVMNQLLADVFGLPVAAVSGTGGAMLGAMMQAVAVYFHENGESLGFEEIAGYLVTVDEATRCEPDPERHEFYEELLARQQYLVETLHSGGFL